jgi:lysozyme family protein
MNSFENAFDRLMGHEGNFTDNPKDPGNWTGGKIGVGKLRGTKYGIAANTYPTLDIKNLTRDMTKAIYKRDFWDQVEGDKLPYGVAFQLFDFAVNSGCQTAIRYFQRALGVADDGVWGPRSVAAAKATSESDMIMGICSERLDFMTRCSGWADYGKGWARRIAQNLQYGVLDS